MYKDNQVIDIHKALYYCPDAHSHPLFNTFFYQVLDDKVVLWVLRMTRTTQNDHDGLSMDFAIIDRLQSIARQTVDMQQVEVKYVLVVPYTEPSREVVWNFAAKFDEYKGDVFVLELDFSIADQGTFTPEEFVSEMNLHRVVVIN